MSSRKGLVDLSTVDWSRTSGLTKDSPGNSTLSAPAEATRQSQPFDLQNYIPYFINMISNKLSRGSSRLYIRKFGIGVIEWRLLAFINSHGTISANDICESLAIDKAAASRALNGLVGKKLATSRPVDRRQRSLLLTEEGRALYDKVVLIARERERILLASLSPSEKHDLLRLLRILRVNLTALNEFEQKID
jgi:DNA-binding MarR family transcriptional regulator